MKVTAKYFIGGTLTGALLVGSISIHLFQSYKVEHVRGFSTQIENARVLPPNLPSDTTSQIYDVMWDWQLFNMTGEPITLLQVKGSVIFLHTWGTWCGACVQELPEIQQLYDSLKNDRVQFLLVSAEREEKIKRFLNQHPYSFPVYRTIEDIPDAFRVAGVPMTFILDKSGRIRAKQLGAALWNQPKTIRFLRNLN